MASVSIKAEKKCKARFQKGQVQKAIKQYQISANCCKLRSANAHAGRFALSYEQEGPGSGVKKDAGQKRRRRFVGDESKARRW